MDPLTLLRELFGEEPIRKVVTSGFDSVHKIAATNPESLSFFSGINEALARQIQASAVESLSAPAPPDYSSSLSGSAEGQAEWDPALLVKPRVPPRDRAPVPPRDRAPAIPSAENPLLDESPLLDAGGILRTVAQEPLPKDIMDDDFLDEIGLSDAEADFLEGISPWPSGAPRRERASSARPASLTPPRREEKEVEYAPVTDWSPDTDPEPVPRIVRAPELGPDPSSRAEEAAEAASTGIPVGITPPPAPDLSPAKPPAEQGAGTGTPAGPGGPPAESSLWKFGE